MHLKLAKCHTKDKILITGISYVECLPFVPLDLLQLLLPALCLKRLNCRECGPPRGVALASMGAKQVNPF